MISIDGGEGARPFFKQQLPPIALIAQIHSVEILQFGKDRQASG
jgi:hypothetical protein